jgi:hypothetical protein
MYLRLDKVFLSLDKIRLLLSWRDKDLLTDEDLSYALEKYTAASLTRINFEWQEYPDHYDLFIMLLWDLEVCRGVRLADHIAFSGEPKHPSLYWEE